MLSSSALFWTVIAAAFCWLIAATQIRALWKTVRDRSASGHWSVTQGRITISKIGVSPAHPAGRDPVDAGAMLRYRYQVAGKDYEGDGCMIGGKSRTMGLLAKALIKKFPQGKPVEVYYDPADPAKSTLEPKRRGSALTAMVFLAVFGFIAGILTAHAVAGKMLMMSNGLPVFALGLPSAALMVALISFAVYFMALRQSKASASWPTTQGEIVSSKVVREEERVERDGESTVDITYRPEIRFGYRVGGRDYSSDSWKIGMAVSSGSPTYAETIVARYPAGRSVAVHYDPARPDEAVLEPSNRDGAGLMLVSGCAFGLVGMLFMWLFTHGHWVNAATGT